MINVVSLGKFYQSARHRIWQRSTNAVKLHIAAEIPLASFLLGYHQYAYSNKLNVRTKKKWIPSTGQKGCLSNLPEGCKALNIGTWNARKFFHDFKLENLLTEMIRIKTDILGVSETHWTKGTLEAFEQNGYVIIQSPRLDHKHRQRVAIVIKKELSKVMSIYDLHSETILSITFEVTKKTKLHIF